MAAYGSLLSLMTILENIQLYHTHHPTFLDEHQKLLESLHKKVSSLQSLLEWCSINGRNEVADLERPIVDTANDAEDSIEHYIVDDTRARSWKEITRMNIRCSIYTDFHQKNNIFFSAELQKVIEDMNLIEKEIMLIKEKNKDEDEKVPYLLPSASLEYHPSVNDIGMVGFKDEFKDIMNKLNAHETNIKIISITGMGGIGKSTLARHVHDSKSVVDRFDVHGWVTFSQEFTQFRARERFSQLLTEFEVAHGEKEDYHLLGEKLYKHLHGRRFFIVADDVWSVEDWVKFKLYLPENGNKSRIVLTTRVLNVATDVGSSHICKVNFLDEDTSWSLLCGKAFFNHTCPSELQHAGKKIARNCKGLPLSLAVIGGLLSTLEKTRACWEKIAGEVNMIVTTEDDERCLRILSLSYRHLPIYLKPCFLYMGIFPEDHEVPIDSLIDLWIAEGFVKPRGASKDLEEVAKYYLDDLIQRNLIYVSQSCTKQEFWEEVHVFLGKKHPGKIRIHDLLRDLVLKEAQKDKFLQVTKLRGPNFATSLAGERRVGLHGAGDIEVLFENKINERAFTATSLDGIDPKEVSDIIASIRKSKKHHSEIRFKLLGIDKDFIPDDIQSKFENALSSATDLRSLICDSRMYFSASPTLRLLRVSSNLSIRYSAEAISLAINSRNLQICRFQAYELSSIHLLWNLQVLVVFRFEGIHMIEERSEPGTFRIWDMPLLRKVTMGGFVLPDPPQVQVDGKYDVVTSLQEISFIEDLRCTMEVLRKISNIQILHLMYADDREMGVSHYSLDNLDCLHKLKRLGVLFQHKMDWPDRTDLLQNIGLSKSVKILSLQKCGFEWDLLTTKVGSLPHLEELKLNNCYTGEEWTVEEGFFLSLKILRLGACRNLVRWSAESDHFPCLEQLFLHAMKSLEEIPAEIGDTPTLESIHLHLCSSSIVASAKMILKEQLRCGNDGFRVLVSGEEFEEEQVELEKEVQEHEKKKKSRGFMAFVVPFLVILGSSYVLLRNRFRGRGRAGSEVEQKKDNDNRRREGDDSWWLFYEYP